MCGIGEMTSLPKIRLGSRGQDNVSNSLVATGIHNFIAYGCKNILAHAGLRQFHYSLSGLLDAQNF